MEITAGEKCIIKSNEMREKYADVINDLAIKYNLPDDNAFEYLKAIARAKIFGEECEYSSDVEFSLDELVEDEKELLKLSEALY